MSRAATPADVIAGAARWCVAEGDALDVVRQLPVACLDAVVTDPPAGIGFMGLEFDRNRGGRAQWVAWLAEVLGIARAATRDGGRALVWSLPRTSHWTGCAVEDAGWSIESTVTHLFGTGWPKGSSQLKPAAETWWLARTGRSTALNIEASRVTTSRGGSRNSRGDSTCDTSALREASRRCRSAHTDTAASSDAQRDEHVSLLSSALSRALWTAEPQGSLVDCLSCPSCDGGRVRLSQEVSRASSPQRDGAREPLDLRWIASRIREYQCASHPSSWGEIARRVEEDCPSGTDSTSDVQTPGRYPPNAVFSHAPGCRCVGERRATRNVETGARHDSASVTAYGDGVNGRSTTGIAETVEAWECVEGCPVRELDAQSGELTSGKPGVHRLGQNTSSAYGSESREPGTPMSGHGDTGTAARFFPQFPADEAALFGYHAKPSRAEKDAGLAAMPAVRLPHDVRSNMCATCGRKVKANGSGVRCECGDARVTTQIERAGNNHPTVKSVALMRWLVRLVTRPGDVVLDPFGGSGTTGVAALCEGRRVILVEREPRFAEIARQRCEHATPDLGVPVRVAAKPAPAADPRQLSLLKDPP